MKWNDTGGNNFEPAPVGTHMARCIKLIDIGTQTGEWKGKVTIKRQMIITWELPMALMETGKYAGQPFVVSKFYTQSLGEKANLRADLKNWRGRDFTPEELAGFDGRNILGKPCMISLTFNPNKKKVEISGVMAVPKGMDCPPQVNQSVHFSLEEFDKEVFDNISNGIKAMIEKSPEYKSLGKSDDFPTETFTNDDQDIPF